MIEFPVWLVGGDHLLEHPEALVHDVVTEHHCERMVADVLAGHRHRVPQAQGLALPDVVDVGELGQAPDLLELLQLSGRLQRRLELDRAVEMVLQTVLAPARDDQDVVDAGPYRLLDHVLDRRPVDDRQHLLGLRLGRG